MLWKIIEVMADWSEVRPYRAKEDPHEQKNLAKSQPMFCAMGAKIILDWQDEQMMKSDAVIDPLWTVIKGEGPIIKGHLEGYIERLKATGREEDAKRLATKYL